MNAVNCKSIHICIDTPCIYVCIILFLCIAIIKSLIGASDSVTDAVTISRIPGLYDDLVHSLKSLDFINLGFILRVRAYICMYITT